jgi:hypothetical protein
MSKEDLDQLRVEYKKAMDEWVDAIRAEEALATPDHSMVAMEHGIPPYSGSTTPTPKRRKRVKPTKTRCAA